MNTNKHEFSKKLSGRFRKRKPISLSRGAFRHLAAALGVVTLLGAVAARADWTLTTADFKQEQHLTVNTWTPADGLSMTNQGGKLTTVPTRDILLLSSIAPGQTPGMEGASLRWRLVLRNADTLYGEASKVSGKSLLFKVSELGDVAVPLKRIAMLSAPVFGATASAERQTHRVPASLDHDVVFFKEGGDKLEGLFASIDGSNVQFLSQGSDTPTDIAISKIDAIIFGGVQPARAVPPLSVRLTLNKSGSMLTVPLEAGPDAFSWSISKIKLKDPAGQEHGDIDVDRVARVEVLGGRVVYLTELDPEKEEQVSFLGTPWPYQINKNVLGQPLRVGRANYDRGIGVHTQSNLVYMLDGSFDTLSLRVGLDDSAAPSGEAHAYIVLDGKTLWDGKILKPGVLSEELALPIKGGKRLELHADTASRLDVQGRVDWIDVALRRQ